MKLYFKKVESTQLEDANIVFHLMFGLGVMQYISSLNEDKLDKVVTIYLQYFLFAALDFFFLEKN